MRTSWTLVALPLLAACGSAPARAPVATPAPSLRCLPAATGPTTDPADAEPAALRGQRARVVRNGATLLLRVRDTAVALTDQLGDSVPADEQVRYSFVAVRPELGLYEVAVLAWERSATLLVDLVTGHRTVTWAAPVPSPDGQRLAVASLDLEAGFNPNGLQVWRRGRDSLELEWEVELTGWGPGPARWLDAGRFLVSRVPATDSGAVAGCVVVARAARGWRVTAP